SSVCLDCHTLFLRFIATSVAQPLHDILEGNLPSSVRTFRSIPAMIKSISAITLATHNMSRAVRFYRMLGFEIIYGGEEAAFTSFRAGTSYLNLITQPVERNWSWWGRVIF